ncbi:MAG: hypothetical protein K2Q45_02725, partial [Nitrosomonas sp.]|nr:hypothetical protein [Nitrosomonas sp.]
QILMIALCTRKRRQLKTKVNGCITGGSGSCILFERRKNERGNYILMTVIFSACQRDLQSIKDLP